MQDNEISGTKTKWYLRPASVILALFFFGPFAIPLVWMSPAIKRLYKILLTVVTILITIWLIKVSVDTYSMIESHMKDLLGTMN